MSILLFMKIVKKYSFISIHETFVRILINLNTNNLTAVDTKKDKKKNLYIHTYSVFDDKINSILLLYIILFLVYQSISKPAFDTIYFFHLPF